MEVSLLPAESLLVAPDQRLRSCTQGGLCLSSPAWSLALVQQFAWWLWRTVHDEWWICCKRVHNLYLYILNYVFLSFSPVSPYHFHQSPHGSSGDPSVATGQAQDMPRTASKREVRNVKDPPVRHFGTIFFNDNDIYVGEYILGKRHGSCRDIFSPVGFSAFGGWLRVTAVLDIETHLKGLQVQFSFHFTHPFSLLLFTHISTSRLLCRNSKVRDGWGVELRHHGERYEGEWRNGFREGLGVLTCANSQRAPLASEETGRFVCSFSGRHHHHHHHQHHQQHQHHHTHLCIYIYIHIQYI